jgi:dynein heavy chain
VQGGALVSIIKATLDLYAYFERHVKPTPSKFLYIFNTRQMFKIIYGMSDVDPTYLKSDFELAKLWIHESWRTLCDRISDYSDKKVLFGKFNEVARKHFKIGKNKLSKKIGYPLFCTFNKGYDGMYVEVENMGETILNLRKHLQEYNEINKR